MTGTTLIMQSLIVTLAITTAVFAAPWNEKQERLQRMPAHGALCEDGWTRFEDSCYWHERNEKLTFEDAKAQCARRQSTLFVPNSKEEYNTVIMAAPLNAFSWIGMRKDSEHGNPTWDNEDHMDFRKLDWLNQPFGNAVNGWTSVTQCAAHWNPSVEIGKYTFFYPCNLSFHYVCERNSTISV